MKKYLLCLLFVLALVLGACTSRPNPVSPQRPPAQEILRETVALVDADDDIYCAGVWVSEHDVLTAAHCVLGMESDNGTGFLRNYGDSAQRYFVTKKIDIKVDLMLLTVRLSGVHGIPSLSLSNPDIGEDLYVLGHPAGIGWTLMKGLVQAYRPWMQVQAPIFGGNSGGPAFDQYGDLVGLCHAKHSRAPDLGMFSSVSDIKAFLGR